MFYRSIRIMAALILCAAVSACGKAPATEIKYSFEDDHLIGLCQTLLPNVAELRYGASFATGFIYTELDGLPVIVTNYHLGGGEEFTAEHVEIRFAGETSYKTGLLEMIGYSKTFDAVFLKSAYKPQGYTDLRAKSSRDNRMGQRILAIGNGMGTGLAAAEGIVAQPNKIVSIGGSVIPAIQISAPINAGNSGSPLFNMKGELVGLNFAQTTSLVENPDRFVDGVSYSMPISVVESLYVAAVGSDSAGAVSNADAVVLTDLAAAKEYSAFFKYLGFYARFTDDGFKVTSVTAAGVTPLNKDDVILKIGDIDAASYADIISETLLYAENGTGAALTFTIRRSGGETRVEVPAYKRRAL